MSSVSFAPSLLSSDFSKLHEEIKSVQAMSDFIHVDVMDGHFVPNITIGPVVSNSLKKLEDVNTPLSIHLMITDPRKYAPQFEVDSRDIIIFHREVTDEPESLIQQIKALGCKVGISQKPENEVGQILSLLPKLDEVLVMGVDPGFGGQRFRPRALERIKTVKSQVRKKQLNTVVAVDGGMNESNVGDAVAAGADKIIAGSAIFGEADRLQAIKNLKDATPQKT